MRAVTEATSLDMGTVVGSIIALTITTQVDAYTPNEPGDHDWPDPAE